MPEKFLVCTDLDGTVLGDPEGEAAFRDWFDRVRSRIKLAYITGRTLDSVRALIGQGRLPEADFAATEVGTAVCDLRDKANRLGHHYLKLADPTWPAQRFRDLCHAVDTPLQSPDDQGPYKASFFWDGRVESFALFQSRLAGQENYRVIATADSYLDILPRCYSKGQAVRFLMAACGADLRRTVVAGDMEHDLDMYDVAGHGIVPANARDKVKVALRETDAYFAKGNEGLGLVEGLARLGLI